jgi:AcrR family transcriptional regulator
MQTSRREREREERRNEILDAAEVVFLAKGFVDTTMDEVAAGAELSKGTLYLYFKNKDELYVATCLRTLRRVVELYEAVAERGGTGLETLRELGRAYIDFARNNKQHFRVAMSWMWSNFVVDPDTASFTSYQTLIQRLYGITQSTIERGRQDGSIRADVEPQKLAIQMWGGTLGMLLLSINREEFARRVERELDFDELVPSFVDLIIESIKGEST